MYLGKLKSEDKYKRKGKCKCKGKRVIDTCYPRKK